jgi:Ca-activated chloride channel homolog
VRFEWPFALLALLVVPLATIAYLAIERRGARYAVRYTNIDVLARVPAGTTRWTSYLPAAFALLALTCALAALARPERTISTTNDQTSIVLALDTSASMAADDIHPTRLAAADEAIRRFLATIPKKYRVALVAFSAEPYVAAPLTWDHDRVLQALAGVSAGQGTAIGDALAVDMLEPIWKDAASAVPTVPRSGSLAGIGDPSAILFLSDGAQTDGRLTPLAGAARATAVGIPVYTIALGTSRGVIGAGVMSLRVPPRSHHAASDLTSDWRRILRSKRRRATERRLPTLRHSPRAHASLAGTRLRARGARRDPRADCRRARAVARCSPSVTPRAKRRGPPGPCRAPARHGPIRLSRR